MRARLSIEADNASPVGGARIRLLEALAREGSISGAARAVGLSYKAAWDAIDGMNNLFGRPLVGARTGGKHGGGAELTEDGQRVVSMFHKLEAELARALGAMEPELAETGLSARSLMWGFMMRTSARNVLRCTVAGIEEGAVNAEVRLSLTPETTLTAVITRDSVRSLGLIPDRPAMALIKSSFVLLAPAGEAGRTSVLNAIDGTVARREDGAVNCEITLDIGGGKTITAVITAKSASALGLDVGARATALIDAAHIIIAVD
jgi:molybdate transport system regulatory protein